MDRIIEDIRQKYHFVQIPEEELLSFVEEATRKTNQKLKTEQIESKLKLFEYYLRMMVHQKIRKYLLEKDPRGIQIITNYIDGKIGLYKDVEKNIASLEKLNSFLLMIHYIPDDEDCKILIQKSPILRFLLKSVVDFYMDSIQKNPLDSITKKSILFGFINNYCELNQIKTVDTIEQNSYRKSENISIEDSVDYYLNEMSSPLLNAKEIRTIKLQIQSGNEEARMRFVERNLRLVVKLAKSFRGCGLSFLDLIQEGNLSLMKAANRFDIYLDYQFSTYATYWIKRGIERALDNQANMIRVPVTTMEKIKKMLHIKERMTIELGRDPSVEELAEKLKVTSENIIFWDKIRNFPISLDMPVGASKKHSLVNFLIDSYEIESEENDLLAEMKKILEKLTESERRVLTLRYGLEDNICHSLKEIGQILHVSKQRAEGLEKQSLCKLAYSPKMRELAKQEGYDVEDIDQKWDFKKKRPIKMR